MRELTLHGHSTRCALCSLAVYNIWVSEEAPPVGCSDGLDAAPWACAHVLNSLAMAVVRIDHLGGELLPHHEHIIAVIGKERADEIMAYVRAHNGPPKAGKRLEPSYERPSVN